MSPTDILYLEILNSEEIYNFSNVSCYDLFSKALMKKFFVIFAAEI